MQNNVHFATYMYVCAQAVGPLHILDAQQRHVLCTAISSNSFYIISAGSDYTIKIWDIQKGTCICTVEEPYCKCYIH